jgi:hypothetical protein
MKMLRKLGIPAVALAGMLALFTPSHADAKVRFGVQIGGPVYPYPYYGPAYPYGYGYGPYVYWGHGYHHHFHDHYRR